MTKIFRGISWVLTLLAGVALLGMMILTFADVIGRFGFRHSIFGTAEIIEIFMAVVIFAGVALITATDQHIKVEILEPIIALRAPRLQRWAVLTFTLVIYAAISWQLLRHAVEMLKSGKLTVVLEMPQWFAPASAAFFSIVGVVLFCVAIAATGGRPAKLDQFHSAEPGSDDMNL